MKCFKNIYGADVDNNRGMEVIDYEIENTDKDEICEKLYDLFISGETKGKHNIFMYCYIKDEDIEIEVDIEDYIEDLIQLAENDEDLKEDDELQEWLKKIENRKINIKDKFGEEIRLGDIIIKENTRFQKEYIERYKVIYDNGYCLEKLDTNEIFSKGEILDVGTILENGRLANGYIEVKNEQ